MARDLSPMSQKTIKQEQPSLNQSGLRPLKTKNGLETAPAPNVPRSPSPSHVPLQIQQPEYFMSRR